MKCSYGGGLARIEPGSRNVFAELELPDTGPHLLKAEFVSRDDGVVQQRQLPKLRPHAFWAWSGRDRLGRLLTNFIE